MIIPVPVFLFFLIFNLLLPVLWTELFASSSYTERYNELNEPIDAVNILPLARFEPTTMTTPPSTTPDIDATYCTTETSPKRMFRKR